jgi:hypothetical protein
VCTFLLYVTRLRLDRFVNSRATCEITREKERDREERATYARFKTDSLILYTRSIARAASRFVCRASEGTSRVSPRKREREAAEVVVPREAREEEENEKERSASLTSSHRSHSACHSSLPVSWSVLRYTQLAGFPSFAPIATTCSLLVSERKDSPLLIFNS